MQHNFYYAVCNSYLCIVASSATLASSQLPANLRHLHALTAFILFALPKLSSLPMYCSHRLFASFLDLVSSFASFSASSSSSSSSLFFHESSPLNRLELDVSKSSRGSEGDDVDAGGTLLDLTFARRRTNDNQDNLTTFIFFAERARKTRDYWAGWQSSSLFFFLRAKFTSPSFLYIRQR